MDELEYIDERPDPEVFTPKVRRDESGNDLDDPFLGDPE